MTFPLAVLVVVAIFALGFWLGRIPLLFSEKLLREIFRNFGKMESERAFQFPVTDKQVEEKISLAWDEMELAYQDVNRARVGLHSGLLGTPPTQEARERFAKAEENLRLFRKQYDYIRALAYFDGWGAVADRIHRRNELKEIESVDE